jgi:hypothetical protein
MIPLKNAMDTWNPAYLGAPACKVVVHPERRNPDGTREGHRCAAFWAVGRKLTRKEILHIETVDGIPVEMLKAVLSVISEYSSCVTIAPASASRFARACLHSGKKKSALSSFIPMLFWLFEYICLLNTYLYGNTFERDLPSLNNTATTQLYPISAMPCMLYIQLGCLFVESF